MMVGSGTTSQRPYRGERQAASGPVSTWMCDRLGTPDAVGIFLLPPPRWPSGSGVRLESGTSRVRIPLATGFFPGSSHIIDLKIGTLVATLPGAWRYRVSAGTGWPGVSIL